jgi:alkaline phosphatase D
MKLSKRAFIRLLAIGASILPGIAVFAARSEQNTLSRGKPRLMGGPMIGVVQKSSAQIWVQLSGEFEVSIEVSESESFLQSRRTNPVLALSSDKFAASILIESLRPGTKYFYRIFVDDGISPYSANASSQTFKTAPSADSRFSIAMGSCAKFAEDSRQQIWDVVARRNPDLFFWLGDNIYGDSPLARVLDVEYQRQRGVDSYAPVGMKIPQLAIWDDHDFGSNDGDRTFSGKDSSLRVFKRYWANPNYGSEDAPGVYFSYEYGGVDFFFLDVRYYRDPNGREDDNQKTMLGPQQKAWLKSELAQSEAPFKILVSGSAWSAAKGPGDDSWSAFMNERNELFDFIRDEKIGGVVLVSGDTHAAELNAIPWSDQGGYDLYDLTSSPLAQDTSASWLERRPERRIRQVYFGSANFGLLTFDMTADEPVLEYNVVNYIGDDVWEPLRIRASELQNGVSTWSEKMDELSRKRFESARDGGEYYQPLPIFRD